MWLCSYTVCMLECALVCVCMCDVWKLSLCSFIDCCAQLQMYWTELLQHQGRLIFPSIFYSHVLQCVHVFAFGSCLPPFIFSYTHFPTFTFTVLKNVYCDIQCHKSDLVLFGICPPPIDSVSPLCQVPTVGVGLWTTAVCVKYKRSHRHDGNIYKLCTLWLFVCICV